MSSWFSIICWEDSLFHYIAFTPLSKISWLYTALPMGSVLYSSDIFVYSFDNTTLSQLCSFRFSLACNSVLLYSSNILLVPWGLLFLHINFRINLLMSMSWLAGILFSVALNLLIKLGRNDILTILGPPIHKHGTSPHLLSNSFILLIKFCRF